MTSILFAHNNFPAQFGFVAEAAVARGYRCAAIASQTGRPMVGVPMEKWEAGRSSSKGILKEAIRAEADLIRAEAAAAAALRLKGQGFDPDVIVGHPGWGETLYLREIFPRARQIIYAEYYYRTADGDVGFDPEFGPAGAPMELHAKNMGLALALSEADAIVAPTPFQAGRLPEVFRQRTTILHEGVDLAHVRRNPTAKWVAVDGREIDGSRPVITFVSRKLEPLRGYHIFMRALPRLMEAVPDADVLVIGEAARAGYGAAAPGGRTWAEVILDEVRGTVDLSRIHFTGRVPHDRFIDALSLSWAHVYLTYPFVMSWSLLEAMACECLIVGSDTAPVRDAIIAGENGLLVDFFDHGALSEQLIEACRTPRRFDAMRRAARETVEARYDRARIGLPGWTGLIERMATGGEPGR
jgi:glycosyltransferase involved in cell wall biosynthesis